MTVRKYEKKIHLRKYFNTEQFTIRNHIAQMMKRGGLLVSNPRMPKDKGPPSRKRDTKD